MKIIKSILLVVLLAPLSSFAQLYFQDDFSSSNWKRNYEVSHEKNFVHTRSGCYSGSCIEITVNKDSHYGGSAKYKLQQNLGFEPEELYAEYRVNYDQSMTEYGGKAPGFDGTYGVAGWGNRPGYGTKGWSARGTVKAEGLSYVRNSFYVYHTNTGNNGKTWGDARWWDSGGNMQHDRWYHVKQYVKLNTPGKNNGVLRAWVDGKKVFDRSDFNFRKVSSLKIYAYWFNYYNGGRDEAKRTGKVLIDDFKLYGPNGSGPTGGNTGGSGGDDGGAQPTTPAVDQCNSTPDCRNIFGSAASDCANSRSRESVCMCGSQPCAAPKPIPEPTPEPTPRPPAPAPIGDQCDSTSECRATFGNKATDCKNSAANNSVCMCGSGPCIAPLPPTPPPAPPVIDACDSTNECRAEFGNRATDCRNSKADTSVCMCGRSPC